jgi:hypothetical protein
MSKFRLIDLLAIPVALLLAVTVLSGCTQAMVSQRHIEVVGGKQITYVVVRTGNSLVPNSSICDRYGPGGAMLAHDSINNTGIIESVGNAIINAVAPILKVFMP